MITPKYMFLAFSLPVGSCIAWTARLVYLAPREVSCSGAFSQILMSQPPNVNTKSTQKVATTAIIKSSERWNTYSEVLWAAKARLMIQMVTKRKDYQKEPRKNLLGFAVLYNERLHASACNREMRCRSPTNNMQC